MPSRPRTGRFCSGRCRRWPWRGCSDPAGDDESAAAAIDQLLRDAGLRARMGAAGAERALAQYDADLVMASLTSLYETLARGRGH